MHKENDIGFAVRRLSNLIKRDVEKTGAELGLDKVKSVNGWAISYFYENRKKDIFQKDFETHFSIRASTASNILKTMEKNGFIERISVENDARLKKIILTDRAVEIHRKVIKAIEKRENILRKDINPSDLEVFFKVIKQLTANMEENND